MDALRPAGFLTALAMALAIPGVANARDQFNHKDVVTIDPAKSYILYRTKYRQDLRFLREVSPAQRADYDQKRAAAFAKARTSYETKLARYDKSIVLHRKMKKDLGSRYKGAAPLRPSEVTDATFAYPAPEMENFVTVLGGREFVKDQPVFAYLVAVEPGSYALYGQITQTSQGGTTGVCLCMGSVAFDARPGRIVDLGELRYPAADAIAAALASKPSNRALAVEQASRGLNGQAVAPNDGTMAIPARLAGLPVTPASFRAAGKMPNYFGVLIDRLSPLAGVLAYRRDVVIDVKTQGGGQAARNR